MLPLVVIFYIPLPARKPRAGADLDNLNITVQLINPKDISLITLAGRKIKLSEQKVTWKEGDSIQKLLKKNGFYAQDGESTGILYKLNPDLDAKSLRAGKEIILPAVKNKEEFSGNLTKAA